MNLPSPVVAARLRLLALGLASLILCFRLARFVKAEAVDVLFSDQWQTFTPLFKGESWWATFDRQHGPHRLGIGFVATRWLMEGTHWDTRWETAFTLCCLFVSAGLALWLKSRLKLPLGLADVAMVALILSPVHYETIVLIPSNYHSITPLALLLGIALCLTSERPLLRYGLGALLGGLSTFTGFGMVTGAVYSLLLLTEVWQVRRAASPAARGPRGALLAMACVWLAFFAGYRANSGAGPVPSPRLIPLFHYVSRMFAGEFQLMDPGFAWLGAGLALAIVVLVAWNAGQVASSSARPRVLVLLGATSLAYALLTALGRAHLGVELATSSRYMALLVPGMLVIHLSIAEWPRSLRISAISTAWLLLVLLRCPFLPPPHRDVVRGFQEAKRHWVTAYAASRDIERANRISGFAMPGVTKDRIGFLEENRLSFFATLTPEVPSR